MKCHLLNHFCSCDDNFHSLNNPPTHLDFVLIGGMHVFLKQSFYPPIFHSLKDSISLLVSLFQYLPGAE